MIFSAQKDDTSALKEREREKNEPSSSSKIIISSTLKSNASNPLQRQGGKEGKKRRERDVAVIKNDVPN